MEKILYKLQKMGFKQHVKMFIHFSILSLTLFSLSNNSYIKKLNLMYGDYLTNKTYKLCDSKENKDFIIIEIDDESFNYLAKSFGSIRISIAKILHTIKKYKPKCIVVNYLFYGKGLGVEDIYLTAAANSENPIIFRAELTNSKEYFTPIEAFTSRAPRFGFLRTIPSEDNIVRKIKIKEIVKDFGKQLDISSQVADILDSKHNKRDNKNNLTIKYSSMNKDIKTITAKELLLNKDQEYDFKDKTIIIDGTASIYQNKILTPIGILPESLVLINAIKTQLSNQTPHIFMNKYVRLFIIAVTIILFSFINFYFSISTSTIITLTSLVITLFGYEMACRNNIIMPYLPFMLTIILPGIYFWFLRYISLQKQSKELIRLATLDSLTGLYSFKYFTFLLQRAFIKQKSKNNNLYLTAIKFNKDLSSKDKSFSDLPVDFLKAIGKTIKTTNDKKIIHGFSNDNNVCYIAFHSSTKDKIYKKLIKIITILEKQIKKHQLTLTLKTVFLDSKTLNSDSSIHLIQMLQFMLQQKNKTKLKIYEYTPSELTNSFSSAPTPAFPETELSYVTMQLSEDKKDLEIMKKQINKSMHEYTMAQKLTAMGQLSSYYAHELKNPMHNLLNIFDVLEDPDESETEKKEILQLMRSELKRMIALSDNMRSYFRQSNENATEVNINQLISSTLKLFEKKIRQNRIEISSEFDKNIPSTLLIEDQIKQVILNLLLNAMEAMPNGGYLRISTFFLPPVIKIMIKDSGTGITPVDLERIFEAFYTTKKEEGTGLGLFACYNIVEQHGGNIRASSEPDQGTVFEIILPT